MSGAGHGDVVHRVPRRRRKGHTRHALAALSPRGGPVQDLVLIEGTASCTAVQGSWCEHPSSFSLLLSSLELSDTNVYEP